MRRRVLPVWLALVATVTGVLLTATPSEASAAKAHDATAITAGGEHIPSDTVQSPCLTGVP
jgi:hypothetical protein